MKLEYSINDGTLVMGINGYISRLVSRRAKIAEDQLLSWVAEIECTKAFEGEDLANNII